MSVTVFSPAKINLFLAVTGRREDGFHDLVSVAAPLDFGDELVATIVERRGENAFELKCDHPEVPLDHSNLILKAARAFAQTTGWPASNGRVGVDFKLTKRIPMGAGLGGGSSNAVAALRALNALSGDLLPAQALTAIAAKLGSDCALFLYDAPVIMRGRGEQIELLPVVAAKRLKGQRVLLFKPSFGISTPWAYARMAAGGSRHYLPGPAAERRLEGALNAKATVSDLLFNNMEGVAFEKFIGLPTLLEKLKAELGVEARMSGSGSTCFSLIDATSGPPQDLPSTDEKTGVNSDFVTQMKHLIRRCWGEAVFMQEASFV